MYRIVNFTLLCVRFSHNYAQNAKPLLQENKIFHCYRTLFPWKKKDEFYEHLTTSIIYNKDGLIALNKPFGIKIHGHDKPGTRYEKSQRYIIPSIKDCDYTVEDALPVLQEHLNLPFLKILKSAERYTSGVVLIGSSNEVAAKVTKSFNTAKQQKKPHLVHWGITVGYSATPYRDEKVGIKLLETKDGKRKQPVILTDISKRACKNKVIYPVQVEGKTLCVNGELSTSLVQISSSSVRWHFVRIYTSSRMAPILGDLMYGTRMKSLLGIHVKVPLNDSFAYGVQEIHDKMHKALNLPKGESGVKMIPNMLHLKSIILPEFEEKGKDLVITANVPDFFQWTAERLKLI